MHKLDLLKQLQQPAETEPVPHAMMGRGPTTAFTLTVLAAFGIGLFGLLQPTATSTAAQLPADTTVDQQAVPAISTAQGVATQGLAQPHEATAATPGPLNATGYVIAQRKATVAANETGRIARVLIREGDFVEQGQLIAELDNESLQLEVAYAKSQLQQKIQLLETRKLELQDAVNNLQRDQQLFQRGLIAKTKIELSENTVAQLKAQLASANTEIESFSWRVKIQQKRLADSRIVAPFSGVAVQLSAQIGEIVSPMSAGTYTRSGICTLVDMSSLEVEVDVNESYLQRVKPGQQVITQLNALPDRQYAGVVSNIIPTADRQTATVKVRIRFDQLDSHVLPDMAAKVQFMPDSPVSLSQAANTESGQQG